MSKPYTLEQFSDQLDQDFSWRIKELSDLKLAIRNSDRTARAVLLRAFAALIYAHWEGYVKLCIGKYFEHLTLKKIVYSELERQLYLNSHLVQFDSFFHNRSTVDEKCHFVEAVLESESKQFKKVNARLLDTKSNLNSGVLKDLCRVSGLDFNNFVEHSSFIDTILLARRNHIAHGEECFIEYTEIDELETKTLGLMRQFRNELENKLYTGGYKKAG